MGIVVLSLCDGISTGQQVLKELGIKVDKYYASEIEKTAISVTQFHFPETIQIGDMTKIKYENGILKTEIGDFVESKIDLILSGTPCVSFSVAGKKDNMKGISGYLFYEFVRILKEINPTYFFFENVKMKEEVAQEINKALNVEYISLNSVLFSCQIRKRYYWTNIVDRETCLKNIEKKNYCIQDILENKDFDIPCDEIFKISPYFPIHSYEDVICINPRVEKFRKNSKSVKQQTNQRSRIYDITGKCPTICASLYDLKITENHKTYRKLTIIECERLQGLPDNYTSLLTKYSAGKALGNGWQLDTVKHILKFLPYTS